MNGQKVIELTCTEVVPLIAQSGPHLDLVISRRPTDIALSDSTPTSASVAAAPKQCHVVVDQAVAGQAVAGQAVAGQAVAGQAVAGQAVAGQAVAGQAVAGQAVAGQAVAGQSLNRQHMREDDV